jgi:hypothetical protein
MPDYQQRVIDEKTELDTRLEKLRTFCKTPVYDGLPSTEQIRLDLQSGYMGHYSDILAERIAAFPKATDGDDE